MLLVARQLRRRILLCLLNYLVQFHCDYAEDSANKSISAITWHVELQRGSSDELMIKECWLSCSSVTFTFCMAEKSQHFFNG